jgi:hypothetical protein
VVAEDFSRSLHAASMGVLSFLLVSGVAAVAYFILGFVTGVLGGPCSSASAWWEGIYLLLPLPLFVAALWAGVRVANKFLRA